jgi:8-oxo-dGTP pyrophosphatase MutT (NUDIX family)
VREETGLELDRRYNVTCQAFYLHTLGVVESAVVFAAFVTERSDDRLGAEHQRYEWLSMADAAARFTWPREREALEHVSILLGAGNAGPVEDVLRVM